MKKSILFGAMAFGLILASCDGYEEPNPAPQTNPAQNVMESNDIAVESPAATATEVSFAKYDNAEAKYQIPVLKVTRLENWPAQYELTGVMEYATDETFTTVENVDLMWDAEEMTFYAPVSSWESAHIKLFTKNPQAVEGYVRFVLYANMGSSVVRLGDVPNTVYNTHALNVTPLPATVPVEQNYYLVIEGGDVVKMVATNPENVYDPATFSGAIVVPEGSTVKFTVKSESGKVYGGADGRLVEDGPAIEMSQVGPYLVTIDMEKLIYSSKLALAELIAYGSSPASGYALVTDNYVNYSGFVGTRGKSFNITNDRNKPTMYWGLNENDPTKLVAATDAKDAPKITTEAAGCHWVTLNLNTLAFTVQDVEYFELIGGWDPDWADPVKMTMLDKYGMEWEGEVTFPESDDPIEFKIRSNGNWDGCNLGGDMGNLVEHGDNLKFEQAGKFKFKLNLTTVPYTLTYTAI